MNSKDSSFSGRCSDLGSSRKAELSKRLQKPLCKLEHGHSRSRKTVLFDGEEAAAPAQGAGLCLPPLLPDG